MDLKLNRLLSLPPALELGITPKAAHALAFVFASSYLGSIYLAPYLVRKRESPTDGKTTSAEDAAQRLPLGHREHPDTMRLRMTAVEEVTRLCLAGVYFTVKSAGHYTLKQAAIPTLRLLGLSSTGLSMPLAYVLAPTLFLGPLYARYLDGTLPGQPRFGPVRYGLMEKRNYVVGPISEELLFRSSILAVSILGHASPIWLVFGTPLWFGLAHAHHAFQAYRDNGSTRDAAIRATLSCLFQMSYTTLFGWFASYITIRTGSILPAIVSHMFCNSMGIYSPKTAMNRHPAHKITLGLAYLAGIAGFAYGLTKL